MIGALYARSFRAIGYPRTSWLDSRMSRAYFHLSGVSDSVPNRVPHAYRGLSHFCRGQRTFFLLSLSLSYAVVVSCLGSENVTSVPSNLCKAF